MHNNSYADAMDALRFTPEQKSEIARRAAAATGETAPRRRSVRRVAVLAAAAALLLAVSAGAGVLRSAADAFTGIFGGNAAQTEIIDRIGRPIGASATDNGVTISADAVIGDRYNACIVYTISRTDGQPLLPEGVPVQALRVGGFGGSGWVQGGSYGSAYFTDSNPDDNAIEYVETVSSDVPLNKGTAKAAFENLCYRDAELDEDVPVAEGSWRFHFAVDYEDSAVTLGGGETFAQGGMTFTIDEITVSPVAVRAAYTVDSEVQWSDAPSGRASEEDRREAERYLENVEILLTKTDGTVIDLSSAGGSIKPDNGQTVCVKSGVLESLLPLEELESISVGGVAYPIG